jgi:putative inorganic carbon (HCO3(-)) transporter
MKDKIIAWCDRITGASLCVLVFSVTFSNAITEAAAGIAITSWIVKKIMTKDFRLARTSLNSALFGFVLINLISIFNSSYVYESLEGFFGKVMEYVLLYFVIVESINTKKQFRNLIAVMLFTCALIGIDGLFQQFFGFDFMRQREYIDFLRASFGNPGHFGAWLSMVIPITLSLFLFGTKKWGNLRVFSGLLSLLLFSCLMLVGKRGPWVAFSGAVLLIGLLRSKKLLIIVLVCILLSPFILPEPWKGRVRSIFSTTNPSNRERFGFWKKTIVMIKDRPVFGHGINTFDSNWPKYRVGGKAGIYYPHNCYLQMAAETGIIGLGMFIWVMVMLFKTSISFLKKMKIETEEDRFYQAFGLGILGGITGCLIHSFVDNNLYILLLATFFWVLVGLSISITTNYKSITNIQIRT